MELLQEIEIPGLQQKVSIQLLFGDLSAIPPEHAVDLLMVSAFPNSYEPVPGTLVHALYEKGFDLKICAQHKAVDQTRHLGSWISQQVPLGDSERFNFKYILCFEPGYVTQEPHDAVANVFRCLNNFLIPDIQTNEIRRERAQFDINSLAMPILASGNQSAPMELMLPALLDGAAFWLKEGLPIRELKLVVYKPSQVPLAAKLFNQFRVALYRNVQFAPGGSQMAVDKTPPASLSEKIADLLAQAGFEHSLEILYSHANPEEENVLNNLVQKAQNAGSLTNHGSTSANIYVSGHYDYFISYSHQHMTEVHAFVNALTQLKPGSKIFYDKNSIPKGAQWIRTISDAIQNSDEFIAILAPAYSISNVCWDEFQCAKLKEYKTKTAVIKTIRLFSETNPPPIIDIYNYIDCTEGSIQQLTDAVKNI